MIELYSWQTSNGRKVSIALEELGLPYKVFAINLEAGDQFAPEFRALNPNQKVPAIVDRDPVNSKTYALTESNAILIYVAEKAKRLLPGQFPARQEVLRWLLFQASEVGPTFSQCRHFLKEAQEVVPYAIERFRNETARIYELLDDKLSKHKYIAGDYSIADIALFPLVDRHGFHAVDLRDYTSVRRWYDMIWERPAVQRGMYIPERPGASCRV